MTRRPRRTFPEEFKREAVRLLLESGEPLEVIARRLDVEGSSLFAWRAKFGQEEAGKAPARETVLANDERAELEQLRRKVAKLEEEREILKKAAAFFAKESS
jgi:transposase